MIRNRIISSFINNNTSLSGATRASMYTQTRAFSSLFLNSSRLSQSNRILSQLTNKKSSLLIRSHIYSSSPRSFHTSPVAFDNEGINPNFPDEPLQAPRIRKPGRFFAQQLDTSKYALSNSPIYVAPAGPQVAFTKRASLGLVALGTYLAYLANATSATISPIAAALTLIPLFAPIPLFQYLSKPYVTRIFRLYEKKPLVEIKEEEEEELKKPEGFEGDGPKLEGFEEFDDGFPKQPRYQAQPYTLEDLVDSETLVIEQIGNFGRSVHATEVKLKDIRIVKERMGWVNWVYKDPETKDELKMYVADNVGGIKMDRIWGIIESNSGIDNGRGFLNEQ